MIIVSDVYNVVLGIRRHFIAFSVLGVAGVRCILHIRVLL